MKNMQEKGSYGVSCPLVDVSVSVLQGNCGISQPHIYANREKVSVGRTDSLRSRLCMCFFI